MKQPLVVGYKGEIGSFIINGLLRVMPKALDIWCVDINETEEEVADRIKNSDTIFLCIPLQDTMGWLLKYKILLKDKVILEQCSLKEWLYNHDSLKDLTILSMHILFKPSQTPNFGDRAVGLFKNQFYNVTQSISPIDISDITQSSVVWYDNARDHDVSMATQQALLHRVLLVLGKTLKQCNGSTYISKKVLELEARIRKGNKNLYSMIQENDYLPVILHEFQKDLEDFSPDDFWE